MLVEFRCSKQITEVVIPEQEDERELRSQLRSATEVVFAKLGITRGMKSEMSTRIRGTEMVTRTFTAVLHKEDDLYVAECPEVGTVSQGYTIDEAIANLKEATELYLEEFPLRV